MEEAPSYHEAKLPSNAIKAYQEARATETLRASSWTARRKTMSLASSSWLLSLWTRSRAPQLWVGVRVAM